MALLLLLSGLLLLLTAPAAAAHAELVRTDPRDGAVLPTSPAAVTLTFDEAVTLAPHAVRVVDATGAPVRTEVSGHDAVVSARLPGELTEGTYVVTWRVISDDGHPVAGSFSFSVGTPSTVVARPTPTPATDRSLEVLLAAANALTYLASFLAGGLVLFLCWVVSGVRLEPRTRRRLLAVASSAAGVAVLAAALVVVVQGAQDVGGGLGELGRPGTLDFRYVGDDVLVLCLMAVGLLSALLFLADRWAATAVALVAVTAPSAVGHSRATDPVWLVMASDVVHLAAGATWFGGLVGLALVLGALGGRDAALVVSRFSTVAGVTLAALAVTGTIAAWRILGSWSALVETGYGRVLLVKIGVVVLIAVLAGANRFLLLPRVIAEADGDTVPTAVLRLRTLVRREALLVVVVLCLTGFLVGLSPH